ncbi:GTP cyclohydrolase, FolE2/MptA family, partial [Pantoea sp. GbtcB22]|uniref:GTP cyclohydrolase, FolE2/MptA family n=1 Tax=Pantoea sp. GbtcB22 TaxID=2824767 RepID=UPI001C2F7157
GIHMSRLYLLLDTLTQQEITPLVLKDTLNAFLKSHHSQSSEASIEISGHILLSRKSLNSNLFGWKAYPSKLTAKMHRVL